MAEFTSTKVVTHTLTLTDKEARGLFELLYRGTSGNAIDFLGLGEVINVMEDTLDDERERLYFKTVAQLY